MRVNLWCNSAVTFNKHIAPRSVSDNLITLITMLLWIDFQKPRAPFIHGTLCLRSLHGGVIHECSVPLYSSCINTGECKLVCVQVCVCLCPCVYRPEIYYSQDQPEYWIMHDLLSWKNMLTTPQLKVWEVVWKSIKLALNLDSTYEVTERKKYSTLTNELRSGSRRFPLSFNALCQGN